MDTDAIAGGITRSGASGSYTYAAKPGFADKAVMYVSFYDALRFANWLSNGQGGGDTESGTYTLLGGMPAPSNGATVARNPGARVFLASEGWGTAAHYLAAAYWVLGSPMQEVDHLGFRVASLVPACDDGADNDRDGLADLADPGCFDGAGSLEDPRCQDGFDNDNHAGIDFDGGASLDLDDDGFIDAAFNPATPEVGDADTQCVGKPSRNSEASCGLGSELALLLPPLMLLRSRRRRRC